MTTQLAAFTWSEREAEHMSCAVAAATRHESPSPYMYVENIFSDAAYAAMLEHFPTDSPALRRWANPGDGNARFANYHCRHELIVPSEASRLPEDQRAFWLAAGEVMLGETFARALLARFSDYARERFGDAIDDPSFVRDRLRGSMLLNQHDADYYLGPHTDRNEKVFTCLFYFPEDDTLEHLGTTLYRPLIDGFSCDGRAHHDPELFERGETSPYKPNSAFFFARTDIMFHGVHRLTAGELRGSKRRSIQMQFWVHNERPRSECAVTLETNLPASFAPGEVRSLPYRLKNRAAAPLASGYPYPTNIAYRWIAPGGAEVDQRDAIRTELPHTLAPGDMVSGELQIRAPHEIGRYELRTSVIQEGVAWFDDLAEANGVRAHVMVGNAAVEAADILAYSEDVALGDGWSEPERLDGVPVRRVSGKAELHIAALRPLHTSVHLTVEPEPGQDAGGVSASAKLRGGRDLRDAMIQQKRDVVITLPPAAPCVHTLQLDVSGVLRVYRIDIDRSEDVLPHWAVAASGFYPLELARGNRFRWAADDVRIDLADARPDELTVEVEPGPGVGSKQFTLQVRDELGNDVATFDIAGRMHITIPLSAAPNAFLTLHAQNGGSLIANDPRVLNYRLFVPGSSPPA